MFRQNGSGWIAFAVTLLAFGPAAEAEVSNSVDSGVLEEVVVTAEKKNERLQDVPVPVTVITAEELVQKNQLRLEDYYTSVPGLTLAPSSLGQPVLIIRGVTTGHNVLSNPTVGVVVDDLPFGSSTPTGGGAIVPDIDPSDLQNVEVLRGPQGTLYGVSSIGGLLKYVTKDPSVEALSGRVELGTERINQGDGLGFSARGSANVPINDTFAVRVSGFTRKDPGVITNIYDGERGQDREHEYGGRLVALWRPFEDFSVKLGAMFEDMKRFAYNGSDLTYGVFEVSSPPRAGALERKYEIFSANVEWKRGILDLTSITGYTRNRLQDGGDLGAGTGSYLDSFNLTGLPTALIGSVITEDNKTSKISEEIRANLALGDRIEWLVGGYYTHENSPYHQKFLEVNYANGDVVGPGINFDWWNTYTEYALFTDLTARLTDQFDVQVGARGARTQQYYLEVDTGPLTQTFDGAPPPYNYGGPVRGDASPFTYLFVPRFKFTPDLMVYGRISSGYRSGGPNGGIPPADNVTPRYAPDKTRNYELGFKGDLLSHKLSIDTSLYYIDWKNIQINAETLHNYVYTFNAGDAKSEGVELSVTVRPLPGLALSAWGAWNEAVLTTSFPLNASVPAKKGDRLSSSPRVSGQLSAEQSFNLTHGWAGYVGADVAYVGIRADGYLNDGTLRMLPVYARSDARLGVRNDAWSVSLAATNLTDRRGFLSYGSQYAFYIRPLTFSLNLARNF